MRCYYIVEIVEMLFKDRPEAGRKLAERLAVWPAKGVVVLALPRGGVPVGFEVARKLRAPLSVLVVRKIGAPGNPEFGVGAIAEGAAEILDRGAIEGLGLSEKEIAPVMAKEEIELERRVKKYRGKRLLPKLAGQTVILVDDGLATGISALAAVQAILKQKPKKLVVAAPVCSPEAAEAVRGVLRPTDEFVCLSTPGSFSAVGQWYQNFGQVSDEEVVNYLRRADLH